MDLLRDQALHSCPYCGEAVEVAIDLVGPQTEEYVEDCPVCCRPWRVTIDRAVHEDDGAAVTLRREDE